MYTMCSQTPFTHGSYLGDTASLSIHEAGPSRPGGGKGSTTQRARNPPRGRQVPPGLGVIRRHPHSRRDLQTTPGPGLPVPRLGPRPLPQLGVGGGALPGRRLPGPQPSLPSPARLGSAGCTWGGFPPQASFLHFPVPRISGRGNQAARVFCVCSRGLLSKINTRSSHLHGGGRPRVTTGAWSP